MTLMNRNTSEMFVPYQLSLKYIRKRTEIHKAESPNLPGRHKVRG